MRRIAPFLTLLGLLVAAAPAAAQTPRPVAHASLLQCQPAVDQQGRFAVFQGEMLALRGATVMEMRFELFQRLPGGRFTRVQGTGLGVWTASRPNVRAYRFTKRVQNLLAPAGYRALISFRWRRAGGRIVARAQRTTPACHQPDQRANLRPGRVTGRRIANQQARYEVAVRNFGLSAAGPFDVVLRIAGRAQPAQTIASLAGNGGRQVVTVVGERCAPGSNLHVVVDPGKRVDETSERDNDATVRCPLA